MNRKRQLRNSIELSSQKESTTTQRAMMSPYRYPICIFSPLTSLESVVRELFWREGEKESGKGEFQCLTQYKKDVRQSH